MKQILTIILIGFMILGCSKENDDNLKTNLIGNWNWVSSSGGLAGTTETPQITEDIRKLEISADSMKNFINGVLNFKTKYTIETRESSIFNKQFRMIIQENGFRQILDFNTDNNLILIGDCEDCYTSEYEKE